MRERGRVLICSSCVVAALAAYASAQPAATVSCTAIGGNNVTGGTGVSIECFITNPGPGTLGVRGGQTDLPNAAAGYPFSGGGLLEIVPGAAGGTSNPDAVGGPGPSSGGLPYIFGPTGLGPYQASTAIIAHTPGVGEGPTVLASGETRYLGTWFYTITDCAAGDVSVGPRCSPADVLCDNIPAATDTTRFRDDTAGMGALIALTTPDKLLTVPVGTCCNGTDCLCDGVGQACCTDQAAVDRPIACGAASAWNAGQTCELSPGVPNPVACACQNDAQCDDGQFCNGAETCNVASGQCQPGTPPVCPGTTQCTNGVCDPAANGGAGGCVVNNKPDGLACSVGGEGHPDCDDPDTCLGGVCSENLSSAGTSCNGGNDQGECDNPDTCDAGGNCLANNVIGGCTDDGNQCTDDVCAGGECTHPADNSNACDDNNACTTPDSCSGGVCGGPALDCDDGDQCTGDSCNPSSGCVNDDVSDNPCANDTDCSAVVPGAVCVNNFCACNPCVGHPNGDPCDDGNACTLNDACYQGNCVGGNALCPPDGDLCTTDCVDGACVYQDTGGDCTPEITFDPKDGGPNECFEEGDSVVVDVNLGSTDLCVAGGEFRLVYDTSCIEFVSVAGDGVWTNLIYVNESNGVLVFAVGAKLTPGAAKCDDGGTMARITFEKVGKCNSCDICPQDLNPAHNRLTGPKGELIEFPLECSDLIHDDRPETLNCPYQDTEDSGIAVNSDCFETTANVTWPPVSGHDQCDGNFALACTCSYTPILVCRAGNKTGEVCQGGQEGDPCQIQIGVPPNQLTYTGTCQAKWPAGDVDCNDYINSGGNLPQGRYEFNCSESKSPSHVCAGNGTCRWTVQVSDHQTLNAHVQLSPIVVNNQFDRCICFEAFSSCTPEVSEEECHTMHFGGAGQWWGQSTEDVKLKKGKYVCITARDRQHSLRATDANLTCGADNKYHADFSGDPFFGGNWLIQGNLNRDAIIDILDFGVFLGQTNQNPNPKLDKLCEDNNGKGYTHADLNGDGNVDVADFTFIQINFLEDDKNSCCPDHAAASPVVGLTEVSVKELRAMGMGELAVADLNNDGLVNTEDMAAYLSGARPKDAGKGERGTNGRVGSLRR